MEDKGIAPNIRSVMVCTKSVNWKIRRLFGDSVSEHWENPRIIHGFSQCTVLALTISADPIGMTMRRKSRQYAIFQYSVNARLSVHTGWISCMYSVKFPRLPFCGLISIYIYNSFVYGNFNIFYPTRYSMLSLENPQAVIWIFLNL